VAVHYDDQLFGRGSPQKSVPVAVPVEDDENPAEPKGSLLADAENPPLPPLPPSRPPPSLLTRRPPSVVASSTAAASPPRPAQPRRAPGVGSGPRFLAVRADLADEEKDGM
jgi:hypothetical protein